MKRLTDNLSSKYYEAYNRLTSKNARKRIIAYVESFDDIYFWRTVLSNYETDKIYFEVMLPSRTKLSRGKKSVLKNQLCDKMGEGMIACVDADYDYLMQGRNNTSDYILNSRFVFHTYVYAIENYQCYAPSLHDVCVMATLNDKQIFDFQRYLEDFSTIVFPLFVWSIWAYRTDRHTQFSMTDFNIVATIGKASLDNTGHAMHHLEEKVRQKINWLQRKFPAHNDEVDALATELQTLGVTPKNTYLYIQGHHIFDCVVSPIIGRVCNMLRGEHEEAIRRTAAHYTQMNNELSSYEHSTQDVKAMLRRNNSYRDCPEFRRLCTDIEDFISRIAK
ncbi:MAG: DUF4435 domain-containing protein [Prevotellaceae bacterium]|nr:DUF4435 domain-containing protein [Prevotellaceae bacterium]